MANTGIYEEDYESDSVLGVDSDIESNFADSPADGYFSERPHPRETFVENSSVSAAAEAKARERAEERASSSAAAPPSSNSPTSPARSVEWAQETPLASQEEEAPPDYESAISSSRPSTQNHAYQEHEPGHQGNHAAQHSSNPPPRDTFTASGIPVAAQVVTFGRAAGPPEVMRDDAIVLPVDEESGLLTGKKSKKKKRSWFAGCCTSMSICNTILFAAIVILVIVVAGAADDRSESNNPKKPHDGNGGEDQSPSDPVIPPKQPSALPPSTRQCPYDWHSDTMVFDFVKPHNFSLVELMESSDWVSENIRGKVTVEPAQQAQGVDLRIKVTYATTSPWRVVSSKHVKTDESLILQLPAMKKSDDSGSKPCLYVNIAVEVRPGVVLDAWELSTGSLDIAVEDGLFNRKAGEEKLSALQVAGPSVFNAVRGAVRIDYWSSRETEVDTISGSIRGTFALLDILSLNSQSGSIHANVDPREADKKDPKPAKFRTNSRSGTVKVQFPQDGEIPERQYSTRVETTSASIAGDYILGETTSFHSQSGTINAQLLPFFDRKQSSTIHTDTRTGSTKLHILHPYAHPGEDWSVSHSMQKSTSTSGSIDVLYPEEWSGIIDEQSLTGSLSVKGKDVTIITDGRDGLVSKHLVARKGYGTGEMSLKSTTGSVKVRFGEE